jgi:hypothetical protein
VRPLPTHDQFEARFQRILEGLPPDEIPVEAAMKNVGPLVENATDRIVEYGIPYFREVMADLGVKPLV